LNDENQIKNEKIFYQNQNNENLEDEVLNKLLISGDVGLEGVI
jgi:hypothetical protein